MWILACLSSPRFSVCVNGERVGFFPSKRGVRQGDPMSPYLFVIVMEVLTLIVQKNISLHPFKFHWRCKKIKLSHLAFADDLLMFSHGDLASVKVLH